MDIEEIKKEMIAYKDIWGGSMDKDEILASKNETDLRSVLDRFEAEFESQLADARSSVSKFAHKVGLY